MEAIKTNKLTKYYGKTRGIADLDLSVGEGEFFGFIGPNGAGKSTTIRTLLGLISASSGSAEVLGHDIVAGKKEILAEVGYLPSEVSFYAGMRVHDVLKLSADLRRKDCSKQAKELCERLHLDPSRKADELSFGNKKKVAIVCALQSDPRLLILDEPTGGLDPLMQHEFFDILRERREKGTTIFFSSHILSEVRRNCNRAAIIRDGRIIACDSVEALTDTGAKRVTFRGRANVTGLSGVKDLKENGDTTSFLYTGGVGELIARFSAGELQDLEMSDPDLEEIFLHYYEKGGDEA